MERRSLSSDYQKYVTLCELGLTLDSLVKRLNTYEVLLKGKV
ncbi:7903_t:CDS:2 [Funneliformis caledonium]|uniref:7903_t:CDS:1 n=1 Tax=Funneliformis caledonium TaxID=1117310 RepID=A0A9N8ZU88_9GLOM|nr:7903_t:CDS:2 [Funneliformis caledonium]